MVRGKESELGSGGIIRCGNCGQEMGNKKRCPHCGAEPGGPTAEENFDEQMASRVQRQESQGRGARAIMVLAAAMGIMLAAGIGVYFTAAKAPPSLPSSSTPAVVDDNSAAAARAPGGALAGSTAIAPDAVRPDALNQPLIGGTAAAAAGNTAPAAAGELTEDQAIDRVAAFPEVKAWLKEVSQKSPGNKPAFRSEGLQMGRYLIHVYEDVNDGNGQGHAATFGWYEVDKKTGEVVKSEE